MRYLHCEGIAEQSDFARPVPMTQSAVSWPARTVFAAIPEDRPAESALKSRERRLPGNHVPEAGTADGGCASMGRCSHQPGKSATKSATVRSPRHGSGKLSALCSFTP